MGPKSYLTFNLQGKALALHVAYIINWIKDLDSTDSKCHIDFLKMLVNIDDQTSRFMDLRSNNKIPFLERDKFYSLIQLQYLNKNLAILTDNSQNFKISHDLELKNNEQYLILNINQLFQTNEISTTDSVL